VPRPHRAAGLLLVLGGVLTSASAAAQVAPSPPGPYVVDVRGASSGLPQSPLFYPPVPAGTLVPSRGNGFDLGAHVYVGRLWGATLGFGGSFLTVRGTANPPAAASSSTESSTPQTQPPTRMDLRTIAPQVSLNFGTADGWSYLSGGVGVTTVTTRALDVVEARQESGSVMTINAGAGARWFMKRRLAVGFDARLHRVGDGDSTPHAILFSISAGISLR
jgi:hypothetical protein